MGETARRPSARNLIRRLLAGTHAAPSSVRLERFAVSAILLAASALLLTTAPANDDFWWQDAPRHALNGAFVMDFIAAFPWRDPIGWAGSYYVKYPALTIGFYPPLFYMVEAVLYAVFGVSQFVAQVAVTLFVVLLGTGAYRLARLFLPRWSALGTALMLLGAPEIALWGRQVMLDIPAQAALLLTVFCFAKYLQRSQLGYLIAAVALFVAALYIKFTAIFIAPPLVLALFVARGWSAMRDRRLIAVAICGAVVSVPAILLTLRFGAVNVDSVTGHPGDTPITSLQYWLYYLRALPEQIGYLPTVISALGVAALVWRRPAASQPWMIMLLATWFLFGYVFFSAIHQHEPRHDLMILFPLVLCAALALQRWPAGRAAQVATLALGMGTFAITILNGPPPSIQGYRQITEYVASHMPPGGVVVYSGYRDGNFVFGMRAHADRGDLTILRADKLLLRMAVNRSWGVQQTNQDQQAIADMIKRDGVGLIVAQRGFWDDLRQMHRFAEMLHTSDFRKVAAFEIGGDLSTNDGRDADNRNVVEIYQPTYEIPPPPATIDIDVPFAGARFHGTINTR